MVIPLPLVDSGKDGGRTSDLSSKDQLFYFGFVFLNFFIEKLRNYNVIKNYNIALIKINCFKYDVLQMGWIMD